MYCLGKINISFYGIYNLSIYLSISFHIFFYPKLSNSETPELLRMGSFRGHIVVFVAKRKFDLQFYHRTKYLAALFYIDPKGTRWL